MTLIAVIAVSLAIGAWIGFRCAEANREITDITTYLASIPADEWRNR